MPSPLVRDCRYLGRELLTWLWFLCEVEGGTFDLPIGTIELTVEDDLVLVGHDDEDSATRVKGGLPPLRPEAASALAAGMTARQARLLLARGEREWSFKLDAETLDLRAVKLPASETEDPLEALAERLAALQAWFDKLAAGRPNRVVARTDATYRAGLFASAAIPAGEEYLEVPAAAAFLDVLSHPHFILGGPLVVEVRAPSADHDGWRARTKVREMSLVA